MRALCGAVITAGALIGLGLATMGIGQRYAEWKERTRTEDTTTPVHVAFKQLDSAIILNEVILIACVVIGLGIAFVGLAYHHHRRHHEFLREHGHTTTTPRAPV